MLQDIKEYRIRNSLIVIGLFLGLVFSIKEGGQTGIQNWVLGVSIPFCILIPLFCIRVLGSADIKLFSVIGSFLPLSIVFSILLYSIFIGGIMSIFSMIQHHNSYSRFQYFVRYITEVKQTKKIKPYYIAKRDGRDCVIHFSIAIFISYLIVIYYK